MVMNKVQKDLSKTKEFEKLSNKDLGKYMKGKIKLFWDENKGKLEKIKTRKWLEAKGPTTAIGVALTILTIAGLIFYLVVGFQAQVAQTSIVTNQAINDEEWRASNGWVVYEVHFNGTVDSGSYAVTIDGTTKQHSLVTNQTYANIDVNLLTKLFVNKSITIKIDGSIKYDNGTIEHIVYESTFERVVRYEWAKTLIYSVGAFMIWLGGGLVFIGIKGRDPLVAAATKLKP